MRSSLPKVLHQVASEPMIQHVLRSATQLMPQRVVVVVAPDHDQVVKAVAPHRCVVQKVARGTGDAVRAAADELKDFSGDILVLFGDAPLITPEALEILRRTKADAQAVLAVAGFTPADPTPYGRLVLDASGALQRIVEANDATPEEKAIGLCNGGVMLFEAKHLWNLLSQITDNNSKKEFYLTDCIKLARDAELTCVTATMPTEDVSGVNNRVELAYAEQVMQQRLRRSAMLNGATLIDPSTVYLSADTVIGRDVIIAPNVVIGHGVAIEDRVQIRAFCHLEGVKIAEGALIGPFARLRPGTEIGADVHIGNFVELKNTVAEAGAKINHLSYIGDAFIGAKANVGAGAITCNYDGFRKSHTHIGAGAFIGTNAALVAPVRIGDGAYVGAGSVITMEVPANTLAVARGRQANIDDWARRFREEQAVNPAKNKKDS